jgi:hypothetical protein
MTMENDMRKELNPPQGSDENDPWISVEDVLPHDNTRVITRYQGVYDNRGVYRNKGVLFWLDEGGNAHFGGFAEIDGRGSQPATHWMHLPPHASVEEVK